ncbi:endolytic transglycosylase MltG, partial [Actinomyces slackii]
MSHDDFFAELGIQREDATSGEAKPKARKERRREKVERKRRKRRRHWLTTVVLVIVLAAVGVVGYKAVGIMRGVSGIGTSVEDYEGTGDKSIVVTVPEGATGRIIGEILKEKGVVASVEAFVEAYNANTKAGTIQAGTYSLKTRMSAANAVAALLDPRNKDGHALTVPEGFTKAQIKDRLMSVGGFSAEEVDAAYADTAAIGLPEAAGGNVEGWLAASTYDIPDGATATDVVAQMVAATVKTLTTLGVEPDNYQRVLIKASIVEREVASPEYYGQVARVIENRLIDTEGETRGLLQMDSTVQYGLGRVGG